MVSAGLRRAVTTVLELRWDVFRRDSSRASRYLPSPSTTLIHVRRMLLLGCPPRSRDSGRRAAARTRTSACRSRSRPLIDDPAGSCRAGQGSFAPFSAASVVQSKLSYSDEVRVARGALGSSRTRASRPPQRPTAHRKISFSVTHVLSKIWSCNRGVVLYTPITHDAGRKPTQITRVVHV